MNGFGEQVLQHVREAMRGNRAELDAIRRSRDIEKPLIARTGETVPGATHLFVTVPGQPTAFAKAVRFAVEGVKISGEE